MATDRVLDMQGIEINVSQPYYRLSPRKRSINTVHAQRLSHTTHSVRGKLHHFRIMGHKSVPHLQWCFIHK